jgi:hypothetical protein
MVGSVGTILGIGNQLRHMLMIDEMAVNVRH